MPPSKTVEPTDAEKAAAAAAQAEAENVATEAAAAEKAAALADKNAARTVGTADEPSNATTAGALKKLGIEVLAEAKNAEGKIVRVLQDAKRVWKEIFHEA